MPTGKALHRPGGFDKPYQASYVHSSFGQGNLAGRNSSGPVDWTNVPAGREPDRPPPDGRASLLE